jgi:hypothetical protein
MTEGAKMIGRVTRCSTRGFVGALRIPQPEAPAFGTFCRADAQQGRSKVIGVIYDISVEDDEFARQMAVAEDIAPEHIADQQSLRQVPVEYSALTLGFEEQGQVHQRLPPQPPLTLAPIYALPTAEVVRFSEHLDFLPLLFCAEGLPVDELLLAILRQAASLRPEPQRRGYLVQAGRFCARQLSGDLTRLTTLLRSLEMESV